MKKKFLLKDLTLQEWQGIHSKIEEDIFEKPLEGLLKDEFFCFKDSKNFLLELNKYLEDGNFYKKIKTNSKNYFLGLNNLNKRDQLLNNTLSKIN